MPIRAPLVPIATVFALLAAAAAYNNVFYTTGKTYYEACYEKSRVQKKWTEEPKSSDAYQQVIWSNCDKVADRAFFGSGLLFAGNPRNENDKNAKDLLMVCPSAWTDLNLFGNHRMAIRLIQERGGPSFLDSFIPAETMLKTVFTNRWPSCNAERIRQGYPKIVEKPDGKFGWEKPCPASLPCE